MTAELPSLSHLGRPATHNFGQFLDQGQTSHSIDATHSHLPNVSSAHIRDGNDDKVVLAKYADNLVIPKIERAKTMVPTSETFNVDHTHYEQWARVPGRRTQNSGSLLRGIQQLKSRMKRESMEMEFRDQKNFQINQLQKNTLLTRERGAEESSPNFRREKSNITTETSASKTQPHPRYTMKTNLHVFDSGVFTELAKDQKNGKVNEPDSTDHSLVVNESNESFTIKPRHGVSKIRDRCALPVSVYQPISIGDHVFLINEPIKYAEYLSFKKTEYRIKKDPKSATMIIMPERGTQFTFSNTPEQSNATKPEEIKRSKTMLSGFRMPTSQRRTPATVSNAEVFDFSQLSEIRHSVEGKLMERSKTEISLLNKSGKHPKWVPNVKKLKDSK